jgi:hypothetical protein
MKHVRSPIQSLSCGIRRLRWFDRRRNKRSYLGLCEPQVLRFERGQHRFEIHSLANRYVGYCDGKLVCQSRHRHRVARKLLRYRS